jgi:hypothetical protein
MILRAGSSISAFDSCISIFPFLPSTLRRGTRPIFRNFLDLIDLISRSTQQNAFDQSQVFPSIRSLCFNEMPSISPVHESTLKHIRDKATFRTMTLQPSNQRIRFSFSWHKCIIDKGPCAKSRKQMQKNLQFENHQIDLTTIRAILCDKNNHTNFNWRLVTIHKIQSINKNKTQVRSSPEGTKSPFFSSTFKI